MAKYLKNLEKVAGQNLKLFKFFIVFLIIIAGIASIATSSIGIQAYNECDSPNLRKEKPSNYWYMVVTLILSILLTLGGFVLLYLFLRYPKIL